jgi:hypothetical protein
MGCFGKSKAEKEAEAAAAAAAALIRAAGGGDVAAVSAALDGGVSSECTTDDPVRHSARAAHTAAAHSGGVLCSRASPRRTVRPNAAARGR